MFSVWWGLAGHQLFLEHGCPPNAQCAGSRAETGRREPGAAGRLAHLARVCGSKT